MEAHHTVCRSLSCDAGLWSVNHTRTHAHIEPVKLVEDTCTETIHLLDIPADALRRSWKLVAGKATRDRQCRQMRAVCNIAVKVNSHKRAGVISLKCSY